MFPAVYNAPRQCRGIKMISFVLHYVCLVSRLPANQRKQNCVFTYRPAMFYRTIPSLNPGGRECVFYLVVGKAERVGVEVTHGWP